MKIRDTVADMAEALDVPPEAVPGMVKITLTGRRQAMVEHHTGLTGYTAESVEIGAGAERVRILGSALALRAMDAQTLLITGRIAAVEYG